MATPDPAATLPPCTLAVRVWCRLYARWSDATRSGHRVRATAYRVAVDLLWPVTQRPSGKC